MESVEGSSNLLVYETARPIERGDFARKLPWHAELACAPGDLVAQTHGVGSNAADNPFTQSCHRGEVYRH